MKTSNITSLLAYTLEILEALPVLINQGIDIYDLLVTSNAQIKKMQQENRNPTDAEWEALNDLIKTLRAQRPDI